jgi:hypothetical protein
VWDAARDDGGAAGPELEIFIAAMDPEDAFKDVPALVVGVMHVPRRDITWLT